MPSSPVQRVSRRPLGVTIAILFTVLFFVIIPLTEIAFWFAISRISQQTAEVTVGVRLGQLPELRLLIQTIVALIVLIVSLIAWFRKDRWVRPLFVVMLWCAAFISAIFRILPQMTQSVRDGYQSIDPANQQIALGQLIFLVSLTLYTSWFMNRWSARQYYYRDSGDADETR